MRHSQIWYLQDNEISSDCKIHSKYAELPDGVYPSLSVKVKGKEDDQ